MYVVISGSCIFCLKYHDHRGYLFTANRETRRQEREVERFDKRNLNVPFTLQVDICQTNDEHIVI